MNRFLAIICLLGICFARETSAFGATPGPVINEFMAENAGGLKDQDGDTPDWIEIYNPTAEAVNLEGWHLTDSPANLTRWTFPSTNLPPQGYIVVFASLKDRAVSGAELHTNFRLEPEGEYLALVRPDGATVENEFSPAYPPQRANVSYGLALGTQHEFKFFKPPTPGVTNGSGYSGLVSDTKFSVDRGYYYAPFQVAITNGTTGASIYFTTNGSAPTPTNGRLYSGLINVSSNTLLRAAAFKPDWLPSDVDTHTYLFPNQVLHQSGTQPGYPTTWQASYPADYGMDPNVVNHPVYSASLSNDLRSLHVVSIVASHDDLWNASTGIYNHATSTGPLWERPASIELFKPEGGTEFAINCGIEMQGNASRDNVRTPKHSFRLVFKNEYGPTRLRYEWFPGIGSIQEFNTIVLRACGFVDGWPTRYSPDLAPIPNTTLIGTRYRPENATYLKDAWMKQTFRDMGHLATRSTYVHLFLNGLYWGIYNPSERIDAPFAASHLGGREEDWDVIAGDEVYDVIEVRDGNRLDWDAMMTYVENAPVGSASYQNISAMVDLENLADYMILHIFAESEDWPMHNWYALHKRATNGVPATRWTFLPWDQEIVLDRYVRRDRTGVNNVNTPARIYSRMRNYTEFRRLFGDRVQKHVANGALIATNNVARFETLAAQISGAIVAESARWGDAREFTIGPNPGTGVTFTRDEWWVPELEGLYAFLHTLNDYWLARFRLSNLYPSLNPPLFGKNGGPVPAGYEVTLFHTNISGVIYYTIDGSDPRTAFSGAVSPSARAYDVPLPLNTATLVRARVLDGAIWSALVEAAFYPPQDLSALCLSEVMYNPLPSGLTNSDAFEYLELNNSGNSSLNLSGLSFNQGIAFTFTNGTWLAPGQHIILARDPGGFRARYPNILITGLFTGRLDNSGETITLSHPSGAAVLSLTYSDSTPWPAAADGFGFSIVPKIPGRTQASEDGSEWRASTQSGGSPGSPDPAPTLPQVVINEVLAHTDPPLYDTIELRNAGVTAADVSGWYLTDDRSAPFKFKIPSQTVIQPGGYCSFDALQFNPVPGSPTNFALSSTGDDVYLFSSDVQGNLTGYSYGVEFGASWNGASFGRWTNELGEEFFPIQSDRSFGSANPGPALSPILINEIQYHPLAGGIEFIELLNTTAQQVPLFDALHSTNTWNIAGLSYRLPPGITVPANGLFLIVATNATAFRAQHEVPDSVPILGPFAGQLQNSGEWLQVQAPDVPNLDVVPYVTVEDVRYNDRPPWPAEADGSGLSLQRRSTTYGNSPSVWTAATPTPGKLFSAADTDNDALPDFWELENGTEPYVPDWDQDPDVDGMSSYQEFLAGTHPLSSSSVLSLRLEDGNLVFTAVSNRTYAVQQKAALNAWEWTTISTIPLSGTNRVVSVPVSPTAETGFYRLLIPAQP